MYKKKVLEVIQEELDIDNISLDSYLDLHLSLDSLDVLEISNKLEIAFNLPAGSVIDNVFPQFRSMTVADLVFCVQKAALSQKTKNKFERQR